MYSFTEALVIELGPDYLLVNEDDDVIYMAVASTTEMLHCQLFTALYRA